MNQIMSLPREVFYQRIVRGICQRTEFGHLVSAGAHDLSAAEKVSIKDQLQEVIPGLTLESDADFDAVATAIADRSVKLR